MAKHTIDTDRFSYYLRRRLIDVAQRRLLISRLAGSEQEADLRRPANCAGLGRIRHFRRATSPGWPANPLPIDPARAALGLPAADHCEAQVFQRAGCNWRCWYCYVPDPLLTADSAHGAWMSPDELVALYAQQPDPPAVIDLSGGQPDLTPEWVPWMMQALEEQGLAETTYLWSDDNLSNDYLWRLLDDRQRARLADYRHYARSCCFKGFDAESFCFNTRAEAALFERQLTLFTRLLALGIDVYATVSLTCDSTHRLAARIRGFLDRLQAIHEQLPLRTVPVEITLFSPVVKRLSPAATAALANQWRAVEIWSEELERRFTPAQRRRPIQEISLR